MPVLDAAGAPRGRLVFTVRMIQKCVLAVTVPWAKATMRSLQRHTSVASQEAAHRERAFSLSAALAMESDACEPQGSSAVSHEQAALTMESDECEPMRIDFDAGSLRLLAGRLAAVLCYTSLLPPLRLAAAPRRRPGPDLVRHVAAAAPARHRGGGVRRRLRPGAAPSRRCASPDATQSFTATTY